MSLRWSLKVSLKRRTRAAGFFTSEVRAVWGNLMSIFWAQKAQCFRVERAGQVGDGVGPGDI
jgi:hypothetical protein